jgi:hypothetical protein
MYCLMTDKGAPPTVETKYEFVHKDGILERSHPYSCLKTRDVRPFISFTALCMPNCGSTSMSKWMWSGMISISMMSMWYSPQISSMSFFKRISTPLTKTLRRYFGPHQKSANYERSHDCHYEIHTCMKPWIYYTTQRHLTQSSEVLLRGNNVWLISPCLKAGVLRHA